MYARATRSAARVASVPEEVSRTSSTAGIRWQMSSASSTSPGCGAPNVVPAPRRGGHRLDDVRMGMAEDERPPAPHVIDVAVAVDVGQPGAPALAEEDRRAAHPAEGADRGVDAPGCHPAGAVEEAEAERAIHGAQSSSVSCSCSGWY